MSYSVKQCKVSCLLVPTLALYLWLTPIVDTSKRTPYRCHTEAVLPSILHSNSWVRELTVVLSHPSILQCYEGKTAARQCSFLSPSHLKQALLAVRIKLVHSVVPSSVCKQEEACALKTRRGGTHPGSFALQQPWRR